MVDPGPPRVNMPAPDGGPPVDSVLTTDPETARVLGNVVRATLLDLLVEPRTIGQLRAGLADRGESLAETSVRHHVGLLESAGMITVVRREDVNGGVRKYYRATTRAYAYDTGRAEESLAAMRGLVRAELASLCSRLAATHREDLAAAAAGLDPHRCYRNGDPRAFLLREVIDRALVDLETSGDLDERLPPLE